MKAPLVVLIAIVVSILGFLVVYSQQREDVVAKAAQGQAAAGGYGAAAKPAAGGYGAPAPAAAAAGGYGAAPAPKAGGYGAPAAGGYK